MNLTFCDPPTYIKNIANPELFIRAYLKWANTDRHCKCGHGEHSSALLATPVPAVCERHQAWQIYVKTRENWPLTDGEKLYVGLN